MNMGSINGISNNPAGRPIGAIYKNQRHMISGTRGPGPGLGSRNNKHGISAEQRVQNALKAMAEFVAKSPPTAKNAIQWLWDFAHSDQNPALQLSAMQAVVKYGAQYPLTSIDIPTFKSIQEAETFKLLLAQQEQRGEVDSQSVSTAYDRIDNWIADMRADAHALRQEEELELKRLQADVSDKPQIIRIEGGLPGLPGTNVTMPHEQPDLLNGNPGPVIEHQKDPEP
jgi:hypothetical protein